MMRGARTALRALEPEATERCHRWVNDPEVALSLGMRPPLLGPPAL
jgi:hypothetical protein